MIVLAFIHSEKITMIMIITNLHEGVKNEKTRVE